MKIEFLTSGYCTAHSRIADPTEKSGKSRYYAIWALIQHPQIGNILVDTGYSSHLFEATRKLPDRIYEWLTHPILNENESAVEKLRSKGIEPNQIKYIIISHFHADHVAGIKDFPNARFICSKIAFKDVKHVSRISALRKGILKKLIPEDFERRVQYIEDISSTMKDPISGLIIYENILNQNNFRLVALPGHACGMLGVLFEEDQILFATDASWSYKAFSKNILPNKIVNIFFDSWNDFVVTQKQLRAYLKNHPDMKIIFTHCPESLKYVTNV